MKINQIVILSNPRHGTTYLCRYLEHVLENSINLYEIYNRLANSKEVQLDLLNAIKPLPIDGQKILDRFTKRDVESAEQLLDMYLDHLESSSYSVFIYKIFNRHLTRKSLLQVLNDPRIIKIALTRSYLDAYISHEKHRITRKLAGVDTTDIKIELDCNDFYDKYTENLRWFRFLSRNLSNLIVVKYEQLVQFDTIREQFGFLRSLGINLEHLEIGNNLDDSKTSIIMKKQDHSKSSLDKLANKPEVERFLKKYRIRKRLVNPGD